MGDVISNKCDAQQMTLQVRHPIQSLLFQYALPVNLTSTCIAKLSTLYMCTYECYTHAGLHSECCILKAHWSYSVKSWGTRYRVHVYTFMCRHVHVHQYVTYVHMKSCVYMYQAKFKPQVCDYYVCCAHSSPSG